MVSETNMSKLANKQYPLYLGDHKIPCLRLFRDID